jgi:DNA repair protein RadD
MSLRPYQSEAKDAVNKYLAETDRNGLVSIPTAGGKTVIFSSLISDWVQTWPGTRVCILAHREELLAQAEDKLKRLWPDAPTGVWSAGLRRREGRRDILIAGIQSVHNRAFDLDPFDVIFVDEAHLVPNKSDTMYRRFLDDCRTANPRVRIIGFTATPYRLDGGPLWGEGKLFDDVIYEANIRSLIADGYLCPLRTRGGGDANISTAGVHIRNGDFAAGELEKAANAEKLVEAAADEVVAQGATRKAWLVFGCGIDHANNIAAKFRARGVELPTIYGDTNKDDRRAILGAFDAGRLRGVVNVDCLTTGLDVTRIDLIAVLRPTQSTSLWVQMVGRGLRLHPDKQDCLVLDFGGNALRHGPLDALRIRGKGAGKKTTDAEPAGKTCPACNEIVPAAVAMCPRCGHEFPPREIKHEAQASDAPLISTDAPATKKEKPLIVETCKVDDVLASSRVSYGRPSMLEIEYRCGLTRHREFVCVEHDGFARKKAEQWWSRRFPGEKAPKSVAECDLARVRDRVAALTESIVVRENGKFLNIVAHHFKEGSK